MDWQRSLAGAGRLLLLCLLLPLDATWTLPATASISAQPDSAAWSPIVTAETSLTPAATIVTATASTARRLNDISPYLDLALCPVRSEAWTCAKQKTARILDVWDDELNVQWQKLKVEADRQLNATIERRGYSASELPIKEKPSTLLKKIEIGTKYMKEYLAETMDGFLGREYEYLQAPKAADDDDSENADYDDETDAEKETDADTEAEADTETEGDSDTDSATADETDAASNSNDEQETSDDDEEEDEEEDESADEPADHENESGVPAVSNNVANAQQQQQQQTDDVKTSVFSQDAASSGGIEFIELQEGDENGVGALKKPGGGNKRKKNKNKKRKKKKGQQQQQPSTLVVVQAAPDHDVDTDHDAGHTQVAGHGGHGGGGRPFKRKQKRGKRKKKGQQQGSTVVVHEEQDHLGLGLLDELVDEDVVLTGGKRKHRFPTKYGRSNGVTRGKKKKKRKAYAKAVLIGTLLKAKIELLLKILGAHLQVKFFAIALIGLLINIARFWIDVKRGGTPSKVVYVEHAHHQHHYEDHGEDWGEQGSYWKRSLQTDPSVEDADSSTDSYQPHSHSSHSSHQAPDAHYLAYRNQYQWQ